MGIEDPNWILKSQFSPQDADRGEKLLTEAFLALQGLVEEGFSDTEIKLFVRNALSEIRGD